MLGLSVTERKAAFGLAAVFSTRMIGLFMIMPVFALYGSELIGFSPLWMGLAIGVYGLTQACLQIPLGYLSDKIGRKPVIYGGLLLFALGSVVAALADHILWVTLGRALQGAGAISSAVMALAADLSREHQRPKVMAVIGIFIGLSFTLALILGPLVAEPFGLSGLFWLTALLALTALVVVRFWVPNAVHKAPAGDTIARWSRVRELTHNSQLWRLSSGILVLHFCMTGLFTILPVRLMALNEVEALWQLLLPVLLISFLLLVPLMMLFNRRQKVRQGLMFAAFLMVVSVLALAQLSSFYGLAVMLVLFFAGFNYLEASLPGLVAQFAPAGQKGSAMGLFASCQFGGAFLGGVASGALSQWFDVTLVWWLMAALLLAWALFSFSLKQTAKLKSTALVVTELELKESVLEQLAQLNGVAELTYVAEERVIYLKVTPDYQQDQALAVVGANR